MRKLRNVSLAAMQRIARGASHSRTRPVESLPCNSLNRGCRAFTLTELLVVITIIAILASLITAGAVNALHASQRAAITNQIKQLESSTEEFKNKYGLYPPNAMNVLDDTLENWAGNEIYPQTINDFIRSFRKAFPRHKEPEGLLQRLAGDLRPPTQLVGEPSVLDDANTATNNQGGGMNAAEAVYFWLGGFSDDKVYPISGAGGPSFADSNGDSQVTREDEILENRTVFFEFALTQLGPRVKEGDFEGMFDESAGRFVTYRVSINNGPVHLRRINLWTYKPKGYESSFVYFDASRHDPEDYDVNMAGDFNTLETDVYIYGLKKLREGFNTSQTPTVKDIHFVNKNRFQILHPGLDDAWGNWRYPDLPSTDFSMDIMLANDAGDARNMRLYPTGPFTGEIADTLSNFSDGTLESEQE